MSWKNVLSAYASKSIDSNQGFAVCCIEFVSLLNCRPYSDWFIFSLLWTWPFVYIKQLADVLSQIHVVFHWC